MTEYVVRDICFQLSNNIVKGTAYELKREEVNDEYTDCLVTRKSDLVCLQILSIHDEYTDCLVTYTGTVIKNVRKYSPPLSLRSCYLACTYST